MKFGPNQKYKPTPASITIYTKLFIRFMTLGIALIQIIPMSDLWQHILSAVFACLVGGANDIQEWFGVEVKKPVDPHDVDVIKDEAIKVLAFIMLIQSYLFFNT